MENLDFGLRELLIAIVLATVIYMLEILVFARRRRRKKGEAERFEPHLGADEPRVPSRSVERRGDDGELAALRRELAKLNARMEVLEARLEEKEQERQVEEQLSPYAQATQLARQGVSASELTARCGITRGEAELIVALNQRPA